MADLRELTTDAKRLYESLDYLLEKQDKANDEEVDFKEIWFSAKARPFEHHCIERLDADEAKRYLLILSASIALADTAEKRSTQIRFLARIIAGYKAADFELRNIVNDGLLLKEKNIDELQEIEDMDVKIYLLIDLLIMTYLDGSLCDRQVDYAVGTMAFLGINRETTSAIGNAVKGILEQKDELIIAQAKYIYVEGLYCYMQNPPDGVLVYYLDKAKEVEANKIIFTGITWEGIPTINIDEYSAETVEFSNCTFKNIQGMVCISKKLVLKKCEFLDCEAAENLFVFANTKISDCRFAGLRTYDSKQKHLIYVMNSEVQDSKFEDITVQHNQQMPFGGVLKCKNCLLMNLNFNNIVTKGRSYWSNYQRVFDIYGGRIVNCRFDNCNLCDDSYLLTISKETEKGKLAVGKLCSRMPQENIRYDQNRYDLSFEEIFGGN